MAKPVGRAPRKSPRPFPWLLLVLLLASVYVLWVLPHKLGPHPIAVDFDFAPKKQ